MTSVWIRNTPASAAAVRHFLHEEVEKAGLGREVADDAALLASELVGNSIRHARALPAGYLNVTWFINDGGVRVQVTDGGGGKRPQIRRVSLADTTGRGLAIVEALSDDWGVDEEPASTTVWAHLPPSDPLATARTQSDVVRNAAVAADPAEPGGGTLGG